MQTNRNRRAWQPIIDGHRQDLAEASQLSRIAVTPTLDEVLARISERRGGQVGFATAVADLDAARAER